MVNKNEIAIYGSHDPTRLPAYTASDAARMIGLPASTARNWVRGRNESASGSRRGFDPVIRLDDPKSESLSFRNLVELHVLAAIRREYKLTLQKVRMAMSFLEDELGKDHPLATKPMLTDGRDLLVREGASLLNASQGGQIEMGLVAQCLQRIEFDQDGRLSRLFPFTTTRVELDRQAVVIDPRMQFGRPCLREVGVPTAAIMSRFSAGEQIEELAADFEVDPGLIEDAIRFEQPGRAA